MGAFNSHFKLQAYIHILAASSARALLVSLPSFQKEGAGKTGCRLAPMAPVLNVAHAMHRGNTGEAGSNPAFPAQWFDGLCSAPR